VNRPQAPIEGGTSWVYRFGIWVVAVTFAVFTLISVIALLG
jgi:hypothetical protein